jgi:hypothetical protein
VRIYLYIIDVSENTPNKTWLSVASGNCFQLYVHDFSANLLIKFHFANIQAVNV